MIFWDRLKRMHWRLPPTLVLLGSLVGPTTLAHASSPDPIWIGGMYDAADYDDVVVAVTFLVSAQEPAPLGFVKPFQEVVGLTPLGDATGATAAALQAFQIRAPPIP